MTTSGSLGRAPSVHNHGPIKLTYYGDQAAAELIADALKAPKIDAQEIATRLSGVSGFYAVIGQAQDVSIAAIDHIRSIPIFYRRNIADGATARISHNARDLVSGYPSFEPEAVREFAMAGYVTGPDTLVKDIGQLEAGEVRLWRMGSGDVDRAFSYRHVPVPCEETSPEETRSRLSEVIDQAFARTVEMAKGRPILVPLSGGLDSRLVLAKLVEHGHPNLRAFSYGPRRNAEATIAQRVADCLGVAWEFVGTATGEARTALDEETRTAYGRFADGLCAMPNHQDLLALSVLARKDRLPSDAVIVNGQAGDFITGGHVPASLVSDDPIPLDTVLTAIANKHYGLWRSLATPANLDWARTRIANQIGVPADSTDRVSSAQAAIYYELWEHQERQSKYVVSGQRIYDFLGHDWDLPLWDRDFAVFWRDRPLAEKYRQALYREWLMNWDYKQVYSSIQSRVTAWPRAVSAALAPIAVGGRLLAGRERRDRAFRYLNYFDRFSDHYKMFGFSVFRRHAHDMRNPASLYCREWLEREGVDFDAIAET